MGKRSSAASLHPGGTETTLRLLQMAEGYAVSSPNRCALDMGAGNGAAMRLLEGRGWKATGMDLEPGEGILLGDMLHTPFPGGSFDLVLSECSFYITGNPEGAIREAWRILKPEGLLALGDVYFGTADEWERMLAVHSFRLLELEDITDLWREYYLACVWEGTAEAFCHAPKKGCRYYLSVAGKERG